MYHGDIVIHIDQALNDEAIDRLLRDTSHDHGVVGACVGTRTRHLMIVDFDGRQTKPSSILHAVRQRGVGAEMIGL